MPLSGSKLREVIQITMWTANMSYCPRAGGEDDTGRLFITAIAVLLTLSVLYAFNISYNIGII